MQDYIKKVFRYKSTHYTYYESKFEIELFIGPLNPVFIPIERHWPGSLKRKMMKLEIDKVLAGKERFIGYDE